MLKYLWATYFNLTIEQFFLLNFLYHFTIILLFIQISIDTIFTVISCFIIYFQAAFKFIIITNAFIFVTIIINYHFIKFHMSEDLKNLKNYFDYSIAIFF